MNGVNSVNSINSVNSPSLGFVIVRHVNDSVTNQYWQECYQCIRKFYDNPIMIVDDDSDINFLKKEIEMTNYFTVKSDYHKRGEILGYYYFHKLCPFDKAIIIHDSVFMNSWIDFNAIKDFKSLWSFTHEHDNDRDILELLTRIEPCREVVLQYVHKQLWMRCFGLMSVISWDFIDLINIRFKLFDTLLTYITCRTDRCSMERIFPCVISIILPQIIEDLHIVNNIHKYGWGSTWNDYKSGELNHLPIIKV